MRAAIGLVQILFIFIVTNCHSNKEIKNTKYEQDYIFFIHNKFLEDNPDGTFSDKYNVTVDYKGILQSFENDGFVVFSEKRSPKANERAFADKVICQIDSLISKVFSPITSQLSALQKVVTLLNLFQHLRKIRI